MPHRKRSPAQPGPVRSGRAESWALTAPLATRNSTEYERARKAVQSISPGRLAGTVQAGNRLASPVQDSALLVNAQTRDAVVQNRRRPGGVEWRNQDAQLQCLSTVRRNWLTELPVFSGRQRRIVARHAYLEAGCGYWLPLIGVIY